MSIESLLDQSREILDRAIVDYSPYAKVIMFSGGNDSRLVYWVLRALGHRPDAIIHGETGTGIPECHRFCREFAAANDERLIVANYGAGENYRRRLLRKGWFGRGMRPHSMAYHILKYQPFYKAVSDTFRHRKRHRNVLMLCGARAAESRNRAENYAKSYYNPDPSIAANIWVNLVWEWSDADKRDFLAEQPGQQGLVPSLLHRSGDCMCGTMQSKQEGEEAAYWFPDWAEGWWNPLRQEVREAGFSWDWGDNLPKSLARLERVDPLAPQPFMPACIACQQLSLYDMIKGDSA